MRSINDPKLTINDPIFYILGKSQEKGHIKRYKHQSKGREYEHDCRETLQPYSTPITRDADRGMILVISFNSIQIPAW